jgi:hypothetical protein
MSVQERRNQRKKILMVDGWQEWGRRVVGTWMMKRELG